MGYLFFIFLYARIILAVAFLVLSERAILGLAQIRKRPNIGRPRRLVQCVRDRVKLITKRKINLSPTSVFIYAFAPALLVVLTLLLIGLTYRSFYSTLRAVRVARLIISYEILMILLFIFYKGPLRD